MHVYITYIIMIATIGYTLLDFVTIHFLTTRIPAMFRFEYCDFDLYQKKKNNNKKMMIFVVMCFSKIGM